MGERNHPVVPTLPDNHGCLNRLHVETPWGDESQIVVDPTDHVLRHAYAECSLLLFPSLYEGFGWPPLEAMANGCPVVCSDAASLPEVVGDAALQARADDVARLAEQCFRVLTDSDLSTALSEKGMQRAKQFSIERMGRDLITAYEDALVSEPSGN